MWSSSSSSRFLLFFLAAVLATAHAGSINTRVDGEDVVQNEPYRVGEKSSRDNRQQQQQQQLHELTERPSVFWVGSSSSVKRIGAAAAATVSSSSSSSSTRPRFFDRYARFPLRNGQGRGPAQKQVLLDSARSLPCCKDAAGGGAQCRSMRLADATRFADKCLNEPDFSLVVCCRSCNEVGQNYRERARLFFGEGGKNATQHCFDRMSSKFCERFAAKSDTWTGKRWSCDTEHFRLGFRVCRQSCGFCRLDWRNARESPNCSSN